MELKLREYRKQLGITQQELASATRINRVTIARYETGRCSPSLGYAERIARAMGIPLDELIRKEDGTA